MNKSRKTEFVMFGSDTHVSNMNEHTVGNSEVMPPGNVRDIEAN